MVNLSTKQYKSDGWLKNIYDMFICMQTQVLDSEKIHNIY